MKSKIENSKVEFEKSVDSYESRIKEVNNKRHCFETIAQIIKFEFGLCQLRISLKQSQNEREKLATDLNMMIKMKSADQENKVFNHLDIV